MSSIQDRHITLPKWLDDLLFNKLSASYCRKNKDLVVLDWGHKDILGYLGTYFPRSLAESYCIFSNSSFHTTAASVRVGNANT